MADQHTGIVKKTFEKNGRHSLLMDDDNWYGLGYEPADGVVNGSTVRFSFEMNGRFRNVVKGSVQLSTKEPVKSYTATKRSGGGSGAAGGGARDKYWEDKAIADVATQQRISYQAAWNTAIALVNSMVDNKFLPALGGKVADKQAAYIAIVEEQAEAIFRRYQVLPDIYDDIMAAGEVEESVDVVEGIQADETGQEPAQDDWV